MANEMLYTGLALLVGGILLYILSPVGFLDVILGRSLFYTVLSFLLAGIGAIFLLVIAYSKFIGGK